MGCRKTFTFSEAILGETPLVDAAYAANVDKIFGTSGPYVLKFNASTGVREGFVRVASPAYGDNRICYHAGTGMLFVSGHNELNRQWYVLTHPSRDVFQVNPTTLAVTGLNVGSWLSYWEFTGGCVFGPQAIVASGDYLYFQYEYRETGFYWARVKADTWTTHNIGGTFATGTYWTEQIVVSATHVYVSTPANQRIYRDLLTGANVDHCHVTGYGVVGMAIASGNSKLYLICGDENLLRVDNFPGSTIVALDMSTVVGLTESPVPVRVKCLSDGLLYLPCMANDGIIVWDTATETGTFKSGFANPVDVIETPTKKWAVQNSATGLKEIT